MAKISYIHDFGDCLIIIWGRLNCIMFMSDLKIKGNMHASADHMTFDHIAWISIF